MQRLKPILALLVTLLTLSCSEPVEWSATELTGKMPDLEFSLIGPDGETVNAASLHGNQVLVFFGFTSCPDVCPTTLTQLKLIISSLGDQAGNFKVLLISVDPDRDTPEVMKAYTASFGPWLLGLTGSEEALAAIRKDYGVYASMESSDAKGSYNVMHNAAVFAFDENGHARLLMTDLSDHAAIVADLTQLVSH